MNTSSDRNAGAFRTPILLFENTELIDNLMAYILSQEETGIASKVAAEIKVNLTESKFDLFQRKVEIIEQTVKFIGDSLKTTLNMLQNESCGYRIVFSDSWYHIGKR